MLFFIPATAYSWKRTLFAKNLIQNDEEKPAEEAE